MSKIIAIESSTAACSVALWLEGEVTERCVVAPHQHTRQILPMVQELLQTAGLELTQLDALAFGYGPGSFTGIRLAASIVQAIAAVTALPVVKISTLQALAQECYSAEKGEKMLVAQDARMHELYWGQYQLGAQEIMEPVVADQLVAPREVRLHDFIDWSGAGNGWEVYGDILLRETKIFWYRNRIYPHAKYIAQLAALEFKRGAVVRAQDALPSYLREEGAWQSS